VALCLVSGWQAPVVRSAGGFTLFLIAKLFYRRGRLLNLLAAVAIAFLLFDPDQILRPQFPALVPIGRRNRSARCSLLEKTSGPYAAGLHGITTRRPRHVS